MKTRIIASVIFVLLLTGIGYAQERTNTNTSDEPIRTLFGNKPVSHGFYTSFGGGWTQVDQKDGFTAGLKMSWLTGHRFGMGMAANFFSGDLLVDHPIPAVFRNLQGGYGGLLFQYILMPASPVHLNFPVIVGAGGISSSTIYYWKDQEPEYITQESAAFLIAEPGAEIEFNLYRWLRLSIGGSYRFTTDIMLPGYSPQLFNGFNTSLTLKLGKF